MVRKLVIAVAAASALLSGNMAHALGVGDINLRSALNQPLDAEIQLLQVRDLESAEIIPRLASPDDFGRAGIERPFFLTDLTFTPVIGSDGRAFIRVTSNQPVREPFVNFLLEVRWPSGRVLREFTLLIDPPTYQARPVTPPAVTPPAATAPTPRTEQPTARPSTPAARPAPSAPRAADPAGVVTVGQNDTLWVLAQQNRPQNASVHQTMLAIQDLNPDAFIDNNINRLRSGQRLQMPDSEQATQRSQSQAVAAVAQQNADWQAARQTASQRQIDARQRDTAAPAPASVDNGDTLRLVAGSDEAASTATDSADGADQGAMRDQLDQAKEQLDATEREKAEMGERLTEVQGQLETLQRLLELKDAQLAALQQELGSTPEMPDILPEADAELADVEAEARALDLSAVQTLDDPIAATSELDVAGDNDMAATDAAVDDEAPAATPPAAETTDVVTAEEPAAPAPDTTTPAQDTAAEAMLQRLLQNPTLLYTGAGLALIVLLLILMALSRRNARREEEMADNFIAQASRDQVSDAEQDDDFNVALADYDETSDGAEDPLVAAEGQIAYDKLDEARETLIKALEEQPERSELRLKLMEVEALRENAAGYAEQATALRAEGGSEPSLSVLDRRFPAVAAAAAALAGAGAVAADADNEPADIDFFASDEPSDSDELDAEFDLADLAGEDELANLADSGDSAKSDDLDLDFDLDEGLGNELSRSELDAETAGLDLEADDLTADVKASQEAPAVSLDDDFDLSLTDEVPSDDLQLADSETTSNDADDLSLQEADDLMLDWSLDDDAATGTGTPEAAPETLETARADNADADFSLSDDELLDFESEFNAAMAEEDATASLDAEATAESTADAQEVTPEQPPVTEEPPADMDDDDFDFLSGTDETATKLDLARAYVEMGDQEGARDILNEVVDEGNEQQRQEARGLLEQLDS